MTSFYITKKLAGIGKGTAFWMTSVGNEIGQILISVLTAMLVLYVDCHCCVEAGQSKLQARFGQWPDLIIRLDIWHFMRRMSAGCTTDAHPLYATFMSCRFACIFEWDPEDIALLRRAVTEQLRQEGVRVISDGLVDKRITKKDLAFYCRRRTCGEDSTFRLIDQLLQELMGDKGRDLLGVPLLDRVRMEHIWRVQQRHVKCIQDVPGIPLYTETGTTTRGGIVLTRYRCARGSTSLESFHLHLQRFVPGTSANSLNFQLYLLEGLSRWNQDRAAASVTSQPSALLTYAGDVVQSINTNSLKVFGQRYVSFQPPAKYTGELIGVDYLLRQTGQPLQEVSPDSEDTENLMEDLVEEEDEGFQEEDTLDPTVSGASYTTVQRVAHSPPATLQSSSLFSPPASSLFSPPASSLFSPPASSLVSPPASSLSSHPASSLSSHPASSLVSHPASSLVSPLASSLVSHPASSLVSHPASSLSSHPASSLVSHPASSLISHPASSLSSHPASPQSSLNPHLVSQVPPRRCQTYTIAPINLLIDDKLYVNQAVDEHGMPGMDRVDSLAEYLAELRTQTSMTLSNQQVSTFTALWQDLLDFDKQRVVFAARHQQKLNTGRFRSPKKRAEFTPGVDSLKRSALASTAPLAQWPDCCRVVEAVFVRLCDVHKHPKKIGKTVSLTRWSLVLQDYRRIRYLILNNGAVMRDTSLQLVEVNQNTLKQWHNCKVKYQDERLVLQGINLPCRIPVAVEVLPPATVRPAVAPQQPGDKHTYSLPQGTAGQAITKRKFTVVPSNAAAAVPPKRQLLAKPPTLSPAQLFVCVPTPTQHYVSQVPGTTPSPATTSAPSAPQRKYVKKVQANICRKCGQYRTAETGHSQYKGTVYCPSSETVSKDRTDNTEYRDNYDHAIRYLLNFQEQVCLK
ncbi:hypothetical protein N1851_024567 [Merluccius polli]|uniref:Uncharacterized protein n=1 Tax=Merluccius polli TaxID=89951 RepID=A0AA47MEZ6_MERPO|nr:hypothetical protein N1851_024567 [Merluccius polli]